MSDEFSTENYVHDRQNHFDFDSSNKMNYMGSFVSDQKSENPFPSHQKCDESSDLTSFFSHTALHSSLYTPPYYSPNSSGMKGMKNMNQNKNYTKEKMLSINFSPNTSGRFMFHPSYSQFPVYYVSNQSVDDSDQTVVEINENDFLGASSFNRKDFKLNEDIQKRLQQKTLELAIHYNEESIESITNFFADLISFSTLCFLLFNLEIQINITKSFLLEVFFGLDDSKKSLLILFVTDLLVGYHSPNIWELFFQSLFDHYGLPESQTTIFLLVATLPVLLDVLFKYLIFRHLNRASPATVATYHAMIE
jgi:hypothetical protein